jgi:hypothetical protein
MAKKYYTLYERIDGKWYPQFGDYSRNVVVQERRDRHDSYPFPKIKDMSIVEHDESLDIWHVAEMYFGESKVTRPWDGC